MATGYTAIIREKDDVSIRDFTLRCARTFCPFITMRDDPLDAKIPEEFVPSSYDSEAIEKARTQLEMANSMSLEEAEREASRVYDQRMTQHARSMEENEQLRSKYLDMLEQVKKWEVPTPDHQGLRDFMISQLEVSVKYDCSTKYMTKPQKQSGVEYKTSLVEQAERNITYHTEEHNKEVQCTRERTEWVQALRRSLPEK